ncbi:MAG: hypothetical protein UV68_C0041G0005 [Candidatus Collierbacteria bacterium GW2011_GWC2_43_12]|uniref:Zinc-ribbon domain-containing protein n=1 Tax=Candidatus Collierbacteria bacterium GW2011_GWC2_43_12 TaxID=1618390 RepID=A0A0G1G100_9BACT|nr:MAG: hypothetical protein UV68_C0041G0005 [Candidatus Collierbacteria bacterium GW2011_GWC2_43_12]
MNCKNCGIEIETNTKFCGKCGKEVVVEADATPKKKTKGTYKLIKATSLVPYFVVGVISMIGFNLARGNTPSLAVELAKSAKESMTLPYRINETVVISDITAEKNAVRTHYIISGINISGSEKDLLRNASLVENCNKDSVQWKKILNQGVDMEYSYTVKDTDQNFLISITKADCLQ